MSDKTVAQLFEEIQERLTDLQELVSADPANSPDEAVIYDKENNSWHGISRAARKLKVTPQHLARVLRGERQSKRLLKQVHIREVK